MCILLLFQRSFDPSAFIRSRNSGAKADSLATPRVSRVESLDADVSETTRASPNREAISGPELHFLHIYASNLTQKEDSPKTQFLAATEQLAFKCPLNYSPTHLTSLPEQRCFDRPTFLVGATDGNVNVFTHTSRLEFSQEPNMFTKVGEETENLAQLFPEFIATECDFGPVTWISSHLDSDKTISAIGFRNGNVKISFLTIDCENEKVHLESSIQITHFGPILSMLFFEQDDHCNMLVVPALEPAVVYQ